MIWGMFHYHSTRVCVLRVNTQNGNTDKVAAKHNFCNEHITLFKMLPCFFLVDLSSGWDRFNEEITASSCLSLLELPKKTKKQKQRGKDLSNNE